MPTEDPVDEEPLSVWFTPDRRHFYLVPRGLTLPAGEMPIRGPFGLRRRHVDPEAMEPWAVPREEALAAIDRAVADAVGQARGTLGRLVEAGWHATGTGGGRPGIDEIPDLKPEDLLGRSAGELVADPEGGRKAVRGLAQRLSEVTSDLTSGRLFQGNRPPEPDEDPHPEAAEDADPEPGEPTG